MAIFEEKYWEIVCDGCDERIEVDGVWILGQSEKDACEQAEYYDWEVRDDLTCTCSTCLENAAEEAEPFDSSTQQGERP